MAQVDRVVSQGEISTEWSSLVLRVVGGIALAIASGVIAWLATPRFEIWPLIFVAFVPMVYAQHRVLPSSLSVLAPAITIPLFYSTQMSPGMIDAELPWFIQIWPVYIGVIIAALCWPGRNFHARTGYRWLPISFPIAWVGVEAIREFSGQELTGGTWGNPVYALYEQAWLIQPVSVFGIFGLELLVLFINFALATLLIAAIDRRRTPSEGRPAASFSRALKAVAIAAGLFVAWVILSLVQYDTRPGELRVGTVQSNTPGDAEEEYRRLKQGTRDLAKQGAQIVVWREGGLRFDPLRERTDELKALSRETGAHIAIGYGLRDNDVRRNESVVFAPDGRVFGPYGKAHPGRFAGDHSDTGGDYKVYDTAVGKLATIICYDLDFTDSAREMTRRGAKFIAVPSSDPPALAMTHYTHLVFRAIENRMSMAKADGMSDAAIIDTHGNILARQINAYTKKEAKAIVAARSLEPQLLIASVPIGSGDTLVVRLGEWVGWIALLAMFGLALAQIGAFLRKRFGKT
jgi:apolipoprotein N-acyltransferase